MGNSLRFCGYGQSVIGTGHIKSNLPCQDTFEMDLTSSNVSILAVADGLGSVTRSKDGAEMAVAAAMGYLTANIAYIPTTKLGWEELLKDTFKVANKVIADISTEEGQIPHDFATTLMLVVMTSAWVAVAHLGDGAIVFQDSKGELSCLSLPEQNEFANEVVPITNSNWLTHLRFSVISVNDQSVCAVAVITDGLQNLAINSVTRTPYLPFFTPFFSVIEQSFDRIQVENDLNAFLKSDRVCKRTDDDKTLVVMARKLNS